MLLFRHRDSLSGPCPATADERCPEFLFGRGQQGIFLDMDQMADITRAEMAKLGIDVADPTQPIGTMSGGQRQTLAIARYLL